MGEVSVIGLGAMGSALALTLVKAGHRTSVWNRTKARGEVLAAQGATVCGSLAEAVGASSVVIVCLDSCRTTAGLFSQAAVASALAGRILVQLSAGVPAELREGEALAKSSKAGFLGGAILAYPHEIGSTAAAIYVSGAASVYAQAEPFLSALAGDLQYLNENPGAAAALNLAICSFGLGYNFGIVHGALICEAEGLGVDRFGETFNKSRMAAIGDRIRRRTEIIHTGDFGNSGGSIESWNGLARHMAEHARSGGYSPEFPNFILDLFSRAMTRGFGREDITATIKVLREDTGR
jgi:3-hydroxyisobutyrate dehydrogenase-like beta-hydroxyacid dehydrogenase